MEALFEFSGPKAEAGNHLLAAARAQGYVGAGSSGAQQRSNSSNGSGHTDSPPAGQLDGQTFEWGLPQQPIAPINMQPGQGLATAQHAPVAMRPGAASSRTGAGSSSAGPAAPLVWAATDILDAVLGFSCHEMCLEAVELWPLPSASGPASEPLFAHFASPGAWPLRRP